MGNIQTVFGTELAALDQNIDREQCNDSRA